MISCANIPQVFMSAIKEPNYFAFEGEPLDWRGPGNEFVNNSVHSWEDYTALFDPAPEGMAMGEASPLYLWAPDAPKRIKRGAAIGRQNDRCAA